MITNSFTLLLNIFDEIFKKKKLSTHSLWLSYSKNKYPGVIKKR